jgi:tetratricopeptide (TPR) repeat protein
MMKKSPLNIEIEKKIDNYLKGKLAPGEVDELWAAILMEPEYLGHLKTEAQLIAYFRDKKSETTTEPHAVGEKKAFLITMAAVVVLAIGLVWSLLQKEGLIYPHPIEEISYVEMETPAVTRSAANEVEESVQLLLEAYDLILDGSEKEAIALFENITEVYPGTEPASLSWLNLGIVAYNNREYEQSVSYFENAADDSNIEELIRQKAYWFLANAALKTGNTDRALQASQQAAGMQGYYTLQAEDFYKRLSEN